MDLNEILNLLGGYQGKKSDEFDKFKFMIDRYQMKCSYDIDERSGEIVIIENWSSNLNKDIMINRVYPFSINHIDLIQPEFRKIVLQKILDKFVEEERYENAAILRDVILEY